MSIYIILIIVVSIILCVSRFRYTKETFIGRKYQYPTFTYEFDYARKTLNNSFTYLKNKLNPANAASEIKDAVHIKSDTYLKYNPSEFCPYLGYVPDSLNPKDCVIDDIKLSECKSGKLKGKECKKICNEDIKLMCKEMRQPDSWSFKVDHKDPYFVKKNGSIVRSKFKKLMNEYKMLDGLLKNLKNNNQMELYSDLLQKYEKQ